MNTKISVIIPIYNVGSYIKKTIESLAVQSFKDFEVIVINDGSTDNCNIICEEELIKYNLTYTIINKKNQGVSNARNQGISLAKGKYLYFLDGDDYIEKQCLEKFYNCAEKEGTYIVFCGYTHLSADNNYSVISKVHKYIDSILEGKDAAARMLRNEFWISAISGFYLRSFIIEEALKFPTDIKFGEDTVFIVKALTRAESVGCVKEPLVNYVRRGTSVTKTPSTAYYNLHDSDVKILEYNKEVCKDKNIKNALLNYHIPRNIIRIFSTMAKGGADKKELYEFIMREDVRNFLKGFNPKSKKFKVASLMILRFPKIAYKVFNIYGKMGKKQ